MSDYCLICECEPIDNGNWFYNKKTTENICPACIQDVYFLKDLVLDVKLMITDEEFVKVFKSKFGGVQG